MERDAVTALLATHPSVCKPCGNPIHIGDRIIWLDDEPQHEACEGVRGTTDVTPHLLAQAQLLRFLQDYARELDEIFQRVEPFLAENESAALQDHALSTVRLYKTLGAAQ